MPLHKYFTLFLCSCVVWELLYYGRLILQLDQVNLETCSAATSGTSIYKAGDAEEMEDAVTSKAGMTLVILSLLCQPL